MFENVTKKVISGLVALSIAISGFAVTPALVYAKKDKDDDNRGSWVSSFAKMNWGQMKKLSLGENEEEEEHASFTVDSSVKASAKAFSDAIKQLTKTKKATDKTAKTEFKAELKSATTVQAKISALKAYLAKLRASFTAYANAKEAAYNTFINVLGGITVNQAPTANAQSKTVNENSSVAITLTGSDPEGSALTYSITQNPNHGTLTGTAPNVTYTPNTNYNGSDHFKFRVNDGSLNSTQAQVSITVTGVNSAPTANAQSKTVNENSSVAITLTGSDPEGSTLTYSITQNPNHGTLTGTAPNLTYTPTTNYNGPDNFKFRVNDGSLNSAEATVSITVTGVNSAPTANSQNVSVAKNVSLGITLTGSDPEGQTLTYTVLTTTAHGTLSGTVPNLTYLPSLNFTGSDTLTFRVSDGTLNSNTATVNITVNP